jgi:hypothetical protein
MFAAIRRAGNFDWDQGAIRRGCNDCTVGPVLFNPGSTAPTKVRFAKPLGRLGKAAGFVVPAALLFELYGFRTNSGSLGIFAAIRCAAV